jgi:hypothetical protein
VAHVSWTARPYAPFEPDPARPADLSDTGLVLEPDLDLPPRPSVSGQLPHLGRELFLNACWARGSASGWIGRVF